MPVAGLVAPVLASGRPVAVVMPTVAEAHTLAEVVSEALGIVAWMGTSAEPAAAVTRAWAAPVCAEGQLVVGTREIALWHLGGPGLVVVVEEGSGGDEVAADPDGGCARRGATAVGGGAVRHGARRPGSHRRGAGLRRRGPPAEYQDLAAGRGGRPGRGTSRVGSAARGHRAGRGGGGPWRGGRSSCSSPGVRRRRRSAVWPAGRCAPAGPAVPPPPGASPAGGAVPISARAAIAGGHVSRLSERAPGGW